MKLELLTTAVVQWEEQGQVEESIINRKMENYLFIEREDKVFSARRFLFGDSNQIIVSGSPTKG